MKCPKCWAEKAYVRKVNSLRGFGLRLLLLVPMRCHHCYHKFVVWWVVTLGKQTKPPERQMMMSRVVTRRSCAAEYQTAGR